MTELLIVGIGGTVRANSTSERVLARALARVSAAGHATRMFGGEFLARLPHYDPSGVGHDEPGLSELLDAVRRADGLIIATPGYHGSFSGLLKNALDGLEGLRTDTRPYLEGRAVGCIVSAQGWQAGGTTLTALRSVVHALRGWPTPLGVALNSQGLGFRPEGALADEKDDAQVCALAEQVVHFAELSASAR